VDGVHKEAAAWSGDSACFSAYLKDTQQAFLLCGEMDGKQAHVRFTGPWQGREVVWDCRFVIRAHESCLIEGGTSVSKGDYIDIGEPVAAGIPLRVCLNLVRIDLPAIQKMIIMIRNYRNLRSGRHVFGEHSISP